MVAFNKLLDPGSVVRESEFARTPQGQALISNYIGKAQQVFTGGVGLTPEGRKEIKLMADDLLSKASQSFQKDVNVYRNISKNFEIDPKMVLGGVEEEFDLIGLSGAQNQNSTSQPQLSQQTQPLQIFSVQQIGQ